MAYFKDLNRRTAADKVLRDKAFIIAKNPKYDGHQCGISSMVYKFFDKTTSGGTIKNENISNKELAEELHEPIIRKCNNDLSEEETVGTFYEKELQNQIKNNLKSKK